MDETTVTPAEMPAESPSTEQTPEVKEQAYYRRQFEKAQRELERLKLDHQEERNRVQSDVEQSRTEKEEALREVNRLQVEVLKRDLCAREGVPFSLTKYVTGTDEESILAGVRQVLADFPAQAPVDRGVGVSLRPGKQSTTPDPESMSPMEKIAVGLN